MIEYEEHEGIFNVMDKLKKNFVPYSNQVIEKFKIDAYIKDLIKDRLKALRKTTHKNIVVMIWLGIIDLEKLIEFISIDEQIK